MIQYKKILMTLALLITAATGAWATDTYTITFSGFGNEACNKTVTDATLEYSETFNVTDVYANYTMLGGVGGSNEYVSISKSQDEKQITITVKSAFEGTVNVKVYYQNENFDESERDISVTCVKSAPAITVEWNAATKTGTFTMPGSDVVLTPRYAAATIYQNDGETEKQAYETLKEAIANVQDGDVIKLDWDVTSDGDIDTPDADVNNPVHFTLDLNGRSININEFTVHNYVATFTDSSEGQTGRFKCDEFWGIGDASAYYFDSGTYFFHGDAAHYNDFFANPGNRFYLTEGKEFVDVEKVDDGYYLRVAWKTFELTIGKGRFDTFYAAQNVALDAETPAGVGLYTITLIEEDPETGEPAVAYLDQLTGVVEKETPMLVYNGTDAQQTVKIKVTPEEANAQNEDISPLENFMGTAVAKTFTEDDMAVADYYALSGGKLFVPVYDAGTIGKNQCWLQFNHANGAPARGITLVFEKEEATGVNEVSEVNEVSDDSWYDLSGRKLDGEPTEKGVYVKDGKKIVIK